MDDKERRKIKRAIIESLENGATKTKACEEANIGRAAFYRWVTASKIFKKRVEEAMESQIGVMEDALYKTGVEGNVAAQKFFLCNRAPKKWKDTTRHEIEGKMKIEPLIVKLVKDDD